MGPGPRLGEAWRLGAGNNAIVSITLQDIGQHDIGQSASSPKRKPANERAKSETIVGYLCDPLL